MQEALKMVDEVEEGKQTAGNRLDRYLSQKSLQPFLYKGKKLDHFEPITFYYKGKIVNGYEATLLSDICDGVLEARREISLSKRQIIITDQCEILMRSFAKVGIVALIDEATGYQYERERFELQEILRTHVLKGRLFLKWRETFGLDYYKELFEVYDIPFTVEKIRRKPRFIGWLTNELVYKNLPRGKEILAEIKARTPKTKGGNPKKRQHQSLTKKLVEKP